MISLLKAFLEAVTQYLQLRNRTFYYDIQEKSKSKQQQYANEIEQLRKSGTSGDADRADLVRNQLIEERRYAQHLSTVYASTSSGLSGKK